MNTGDRELLELAAKAIGRRIAGWNQQHGIEVAVLDDGSFWQPLSENHITDCMGDALRLAVKLGMVVDVRYKAPETMKFNRVYYWPNGKEHESWKGFDFDLDICPCAATRRAIVRAAAEIGRLMTSNGALNWPNE